MGCTHKYLGSWLAPDCFNRGIEQHELQSPLPVSAIPWFWDSEPSRYKLERDRKGLGNLKTAISIAQNLKGEKIIQDSLRRAGIQLKNENREKNYPKSE